MVTRMPRNIHDGANGAVSRSIKPSSLVSSSKGSHSTHSTISTRTNSSVTRGGSFSNSSKKTVSISSDDGSGNGGGVAPPGKVPDDSNSSRSMSSFVGSARKMNRGSFRRTLMFQKSKRNNGTNATDTKETMFGGKSSVSEGVSVGSASNRMSTGRPTIIFQKNQRSFRGSDVGSAVPATEEEREAGASSPIASQPNASNAILMAESSSFFSADYSQTLQKQRLHERVVGNGPLSGKGADLPQGHVDTILRFYAGNNKSPDSLDLYRDVLKVSPKASDREIRIAYFRRGREILGESGGKAGQTYSAAKAKATKLDPATKSRFQAVSMAYEILSTPSWKESYLQQGGLLRRNLDTKNEIDKNVPQDKILTNSIVDDPFSSSPSTVAAAFPNKGSSDDSRFQKLEPDSTPMNSTPRNNVIQGRENRFKTQQRLPTALRKSSFIRQGQNGKISAGRKKLTQRTSSSVRWKDHVEELVFANHPNEHASDDDSDSDVFEYCPVDNVPQDDIPEEVLRKTGHQNVPTGNGTDPYTDSPLSGHGKSRRRKKNKPKIVIDSEELESHLKRMDNEAEKHFVQDFWDNFEESMDGILSLVDSIGGGGGDKSKRKGDRNGSKSSSTTTPFTNASSWLSPNSHSNSYPSQRQSHKQWNRVEVNNNIGRSSSHDYDLTTENEDSNGGLVQRSNSFPIPNSSPSTLDAVSPSPLPLNFIGSGSTSNPASAVTPDEKGRTLNKTVYDSGVSSPSGMILNSWPFQNRKSQEAESIHHEQPQHGTSSTTSPLAVVSPSPKSEKTSSSSPPTDLDATTSVASSMLSSTQHRQKFFRPISPAPSEASELMKSDFLSGSGSGNILANGESDQFELESRLSEMGSLDLTELDNPFRPEEPSSSSSAVDTNGGLSDDASKGNSSTINKKKKKNRFRVSMMSTSSIKRSPGEDKESSSLNLVQADTSSTVSAASKSGQSVEDVFAGVDEDTQPPQQYDMADGGNLKVHDISIERSASHMSDLSGSIFSSKNEKGNSDAKTFEFTTANASAGIPARESASAIFNPSVTTAASSVMSSSTRKSLLNSASERSQASVGYSSFTSSTRDGTDSVHSIESTGVETSGFFEYFIAYVTAVMTECANLGASTAEYHQDFIGLFSNETSAHTAEIRDQPSSVRRVPSESTRSTLSF